MERITSKNNQLVKDIKRLITSTGERAEKKLFVLEGARLCFDVLNSAYRVKYFLITESALGAYPEKAKKLEAVSEKSFIISDEVADKLSDTKTAQGVFAVCPVRESEAKLTDKLIALDNLQDPANIGAVFRTAEALGIKTVITSNCCDIYNPKTLRASMGGVLRLDTVDCKSLSDMLVSLKNDYRVYSTVPDASAEKITETDFSGKCICVIGNEANGVSEEVKAVSDSLITVPMQGNAESLNASAAAAIVMWEMLR
ncbi:MAG: RNA methyltransferase [Eubacterium sp.]|nr:RNA methyltransferase [Eubacterium sp.]